MDSAIIEGTRALHAEMKEWMGQLHRNPELSMKEAETARHKKSGKKF